MLTTGKIPVKWKTAKIIHSQNQGKNVLFPQNRIPISLLTFMKKLLPNYQMGFRSQHSTNHAIARVAKYIMQSQNKREKSIALFMDIEKAFDKVHHKLLVYKLIDANIPDVYWKIINDFLKDRQFYTTLDGTKSSLRKIQAGVYQGSVLSPLLCALYTCDIPKSGVANVTWYADDTAYWEKWAIKINPTKNALIIFTKARNDNKEIQMYNEAIHPQKPLNI
ncbi:hypothetical protein PR048_026451 [Dryococelus australis]|uniref:Reverse transcriptase domain-containing protein n=1 Tax=Dryococelus australis TaxID=614101 RepID=A0ABQ9GLC6_9NEOP|nr:hypothetical protein PR048_026451 [Dryococelus australis]